ncbi:MAG: acyl-CoA dehydrogenase, partial [Acidimicrobiia bacterium]|nr:acyl-CoA dehydrogenase [Acidimicrobiia bacterium]
RASLQISAAKVYVTDLAMNVTTSATQLMGGWGYLSSGKVERLMREAKLNQIVDGANEIHRTLIARELSDRHSEKGQK